MKLFPVLMGVAVSLTVAACTDVNRDFLDPRVAAETGFPELATELGAVKDDCILLPEDWEPVFKRNNIVTRKRFGNVLYGMIKNDQALYFKEKRVIAVKEPFCTPS